MWEPDQGTEGGTPQGRPCSEKLGFASVFTHTLEHKFIDSTGW